jgi:thiol-disulfide isomerase/thioredoxin
VVQEFGGRVRFVVENYGDSELARRFGVTRYPAIFVDDVLVATPKDFGFYGKGEGGGEGRYAPLKSAASHERFRKDLTRMIELVLAGRKGEARAQGSPVETEPIPSLPDFRLTVLAGRVLSRESFPGRFVLVEFWATWCPPCRGTLAWLRDLQRRHPDRLAVLAVALESEEAEVRRLRDEVGPELVWAMATPELARSFGDISAVPTLFLFDPEGRTVATYYGAPPGLHARAEDTLTSLLQ